MKRSYAMTKILGLYHSVRDIENMSLAIKKLVIFLMVVLQSLLDQFLAKVQLSALMTRRFH